MVMIERFSTNGHYVFDHQTDNQWLVNEVEANEIVKTMNNLDMKAKERSKALSTLQKKYDTVELENKKLNIKNAMLEQVKPIKELPKTIDVRDVSPNVKPFVVVHKGGIEFLAETKTNHLLPVADIKAMCILLNYAYVNGDIPVVDTVGWWETEVMQDYLIEDEWGE